MCYHYLELMYYTEALVIITQFYFILITFLGSVSLVHMLSTRFHKKEAWSILWCNDYKMWACFVECGCLLSIIAHHEEATKIGQGALEPRKAGLNSLVHRLSLTIVRGKPGIF